MYNVYNLYMYNFYKWTLYIVQQHSLAQCSLSIYSESGGGFVFKSELDLLFCDFAETYFSSTQLSSRHSTEFPQISKLLRSKFKGGRRRNGDLTNAFIWFSLLGYLIHTLGWKVLHGWSSYFDQTWVKSCKVEQIRGTPFQLFANFDKSWAKFGLIFLGKKWKAWPRPPFWVIFGWILCGLWLGDDGLCGGWWCLVAGKCYLVAGGC